MEMTQKNNVVDGRGHKFKIELAYFYSGRVENSQ